jgi:phospholipase C
MSLGRRLALVVVIAGMIAPGSSVSGRTAAVLLRVRSAPTSSVSGGKIQHVVFIIQENRGFNNLFQGYPGADTRPTGLDSKGRTIRLKPVSLAAPYDIDHSSVAFFQAYDSGKMDGFDKESTTANLGAYPHPQYGYVPHKESKLYFEMAGQYVLADHMFASQIDASYVSHQYAIAGQANHAVDFPSGVWGCDGPQDTITRLTETRSYGRQMPVCQDYMTLGDELDAAGLTWRYYAFSKQSLWVAYRSIHHIFRGPDWKTNVIGSPARVLTDIQHGRLANVAWVTPTAANSDHPGGLSTTGPAWVASVVNAVGESQYWDSTAIFVIWDEWGGWDDYVKPPYEDYDGLGFRIPLLMISPYAKSGVVTHLQYEHGSILRFIEDNWGLAQLSASDTRARDPGQYEFDFNRAPRPFVPFKTSLTPDDFIRMERTQRQAVPDPE